MQYHYFLASTYGSGTYNTDVYNGSTSTGTSTGTGSGSSSGGVLTNTGFDIAAAVTLACVIVFVALVVRFWKRPAKQAAEAVADETDNR